MGLVGNYGYLIFLLSKNLSKSLKTLASTNQQIGWPPCQQIFRARLCSIFMLPRTRASLPLNVWLTIPHSANNVTYFQTKPKLSQLHARNALKIYQCLGSSKLHNNYGEQSLKLNSLHQVRSRMKSQPISLLIIFVLPLFYIFREDD